MDGACEDVVDAKAMADSQRQYPTAEVGLYGSIVFDIVFDLIAIIDRQHRIERVNRAIARRLGVEPEQCSGLPCYTCIHGLDAPLDSCPHAQALADGREHAAEIHKKRLGGDFLVTCTPLFDQNGEAIGTLHVARDVTEHKQTEEKITHLAAIVESSDDTIIGKSLDGRILSWNKGAEQIYGYTAEEVVGNPISILSRTAKQNELGDIIARIKQGEAIKRLKPLAFGKTAGLFTYP
jgi:PAS domain S-box-containing protein